MMSPAEKPSRSEVGSASPATLSRCGEKQRTQKMKNRANNATVSDQRRRRFVAFSLLLLFCPSFFPTSLSFSSTCFLAQFSPFASARDKVRRISTPEQRLGARSIHVSVEKYGVIGSLELPSAIVRTPIVFRNPSSRTIGCASQLPSLSYG